MRTLLIGLAGVLAVIGGAQAAKEDARLGCKLDGLELVAEGSGFDGEKFRITKVESYFKRLTPPKVNDFHSDGYVKALVEGRKGKFLLVEAYSGWGMPADYGSLKDASASDIKGINTSRRSAAGEKARVNGIFYIWDQPYEGVSFYPVSCK